MDFTLETLTPVFIGTGEEVSPIEYVIDGNMVYRVNMKKIIQTGNFDSTSFIQFVQTNHPPYFGDFSRALGIAHPLYTIETERALANLLLQQKANIKEQIKTNNAAYIPGSSLKGAIFSAMWWYFLKDKDNKDLHNTVVACLKGGRVPRNKYRLVLRNNRPDFESTLKNIVFNRLIEASYIKSIQRARQRIKPNFLSWIKVGDCIPHQIDILRLERVELKGSKRDLKEFMETIKEGIQFNVLLKNHHSTLNTEKEILEICDQFYSKVLLKDIEWCRQNKVNSKSLEAFQQEKYKIKVGQTVSAWSTSSLILAEAHNVLNQYIPQWRRSIKKSYHPSDPPLTRKILASNSPLMGWVKIIAK